MYRFSVRVVVEGPSDRYFFEPLLERALVQLCVDLAEPPIDIDVSALQPQVRTGESRHEAILRQVRAVTWMDVVLLHVDGTSRPHRELTNHLEPLRALWNDAELPRLLPLVPVREMEAWALADRPLLITLFGGDWAPVDVFESARLGRVEDLTDPKRTLNEIVALAPRGRGRHRTAADYLPLVAQLISLEALAHVPSYVTWEQDMRVALLELIERGAR